MSRSPEVRPRSENCFSVTQRLFSGRGMGWGSSLAAKSVIVVRHKAISTRIVIEVVLYNSSGIRIIRVVGNVGAMSDSD